MHCLFDDRKANLLSHVQLAAEDGAHVRHTTIEVSKFDSRGWFCMWCSKLPFG